MDMGVSGDSVALLRRCLAAVVAHAPDDGDAFLQLVDAHVASGEPEQIRAAIEQINTRMHAVPGSRDDLKLWIRLARCYLIVRDAKNSHYVLITALNFYNDNAELWAYLGKCFYLLNKPRDALQALTNSLYLLPKELTTQTDFDVARCAHLELAKVVLDDGDIESAKVEFGIVCSLPRSGDSDIQRRTLILAHKLILHFYKIGDFLNAIWICEAFEKANDDSHYVLLFHSFLILFNPHSPNYDPLFANRLLIKCVRKDPGYHDSSDLIAFLNSPVGNFLPWLLFTDCYLSLQYHELMFDCLQVAINKCSQRCWHLLQTQYESLKRKFKKSSYDHDNETLQLRWIEFDRLIMIPLDNTEKRLDLKDLFLLNEDEFGKYLDIPIDQPEIVVLQNHYELQQMQQQLPQQLPLPHQKKGSTILDSSSLSASHTQQSPLRPNSTVTAPVAPMSLPAMQTPVKTPAATTHANNPHLLRHSNLEHSPLVAHQMLMQQHQVQQAQQAQQIQAQAQAQQQQQHLAQAQHLHHLAPQQHFQHQQLHFPQQPQQQHNNNINNNHLPMAPITSLSPLGAQMQFTPGLQALQSLPQQGGPVNKSYGWFGYTS